jgi:SPP1 gp7 family putative phage head morphogenesis protein
MIPANHSPLQPPGGRAAANASIAKVANVLAHYMAAFDILGRSQVVSHCARKAKVSVPMATTSRLTRFADGDLRISPNFELPSEGALSFLRNLTPVTREVYDGLTSQYRKIAFTLAGIADERLIAKIQDALTETNKSGGTQEDFEKRVNEITDDAGIQRLDAFNIDVAFSTATAKAYAAGRYEQMTQPAVLDVLPYWQYLTVGDTHVRPEHAVLDYFVARADDPVWNKIYPPNGFGCRCNAISLLVEEAMRFKGYDEPGMERLPLLAFTGVPQKGFSKVFWDLAA